MSQMLIGVGFAVGRDMAGCVCIFDSWRSIIIERAFGLEIECVSEALGMKEVFHSSRKYREKETDAFLAD